MIVTRSEVRIWVESVFAALLHIGYGGHCRFPGRAAHRNIAFAQGTYKSSAIGGDDGPDQVANF